METRALRNTVSTRNQNTTLLGKSKMAPARSATNLPRAALGDMTNVGRHLPAKEKAKTKEISIKPLEEKQLLGRPRLRNNQESSKNCLNHISIQKSQPIIIEDDVIEIDDEDENMDLESPKVDVEDIDGADLSNPLLCAEYVKDIYMYMKKLEKKLKVGDYMATQSQINAKMRSILVDWLIQVQSRFNLLQETLFLTVYLIDRFLMSHDVQRSELQLVGVTAMLLASKYEEMYAPEINDFVYITDNAYTKAKIRTMEQKMLRALDFDLSNPSCLHFLRRNSKAGSVDAVKHTLAKYLMELTLVDYDLARCLPSEIASAALYLALKVIDGSAWSTVLEHYSGFSESELMPTVSKLAQLVLKAESSKYQAVTTKYSASKFMRISRLPELQGELVKQIASSQEKS